MATDALGRFVAATGQLTEQQWTTVLRAWLLLLRFQDGTLPRTGRKAQRAVEKAGLAGRVSSARAAVRLPAAAGSMLAELATTAPEEPATAETVRSLLSSATATALLALAARPHLRAPEFGFLYVAFAEALPVAGLEG